MRRLARAAGTRRLDRNGGRSGVRRLLGARGLVVALVVASFASVLSQASGAGEGGSTTSVSIRGDDFLVNGEVTYEGRTGVELESGGTVTLEGLLLNARMINAVFDDENESTRSNWRYPSGPAQDWSPDRHTAEFVAMLPTYRQHGLLMVTVGLQGGNPTHGSDSQNGDPPAWIVSAFDASGNLKQAWLDRLAAVIEAADAVGMIVNVQCFYQRQESRLTTPTREDAAKNAVDRITDWISDRGYENVLLSIQNEVGSGFWQSNSIFSMGRAHELIERAKTRHPELLVGTHLHPGTDYSAGVADAIIAASDFVSPGMNGLSISKIEAQIDAIRARAVYGNKPIFVPEDRATLSQFDAALRKGVGWGYHDPGYSSTQPRSNYHEGFQAVPANWAINTSEKAEFFDHLARLTATTTSEPSEPASPYELYVSSSADRADPVGLAGETVSGDAYIFVAPEDGVAGVRLWLDDPDLSGAPVRVEANPPWDFGGGDAHGADPFDTRTLADGSHTVTAELELEGGELEIVSAVFSVANSTPELAFSPPSLSFTLEEGAVGTAASRLTASGESSTSFAASADRAWVSVSPSSGSTPATLTVTVDTRGVGPGTYSATVYAESGGASATQSIELTVTAASTSAYELLVSSSPDRADPVPLAGVTVAGLVYFFLSAPAGVDGVAFWLDDPDRSGRPVRRERNAPWDFAGGGLELAKPFDTAQLGNGTHTITAELDLESGGSEVVTAAFNASN